MKSINNGSLQLRVEATEFKGKNFIDVRNFYQTSTEDWKPTPKGIMIPLTHAEEVANAILAECKKHAKPIITDRSSEDEGSDTLLYAICTRPARHINEVGLSLLTSRTYPTLAAAVAANNPATLFSSNKVTVDTLYIVKCLDFEEKSNDHIRIIKAEAKAKVTRDDPKWTRIVPRVKK